MVGFEFKGKNINPQSLKWGRYMDLLGERKKAIESNDEFTINLVIEKSLFETCGLTRDDIKDWTPEEVFACIAKMRDASTLPLQPKES